VTLFAVPLHSTLPTHVSHAPPCLGRFWKRLSTLCDVRIAPALCEVDMVPRGVAAAAFGVSWELPTAVQGPRAASDPGWLRFWPGWLWTFSS
jgi:hypothetical protein